MSVIRGAKGLVKVPVKVELVDDGEDIDVEFIAIFNRMTKSKAKEIRRVLRDVQIKIDVLATEEGNLDLSKKDDVKRKNAIAAELDSLVDSLDAPLSENLVGWEALEGEDGKPVPFNEENKAEMLLLAPYYESLQIAFRDATGKRQEIKNS